MKKYKDFIRNTLLIPSVTTGLVMIITLVASLCGSIGIASAAPTHTTPGSSLVGHSFAFNMAEPTGKYTCGGGTQAVSVAVDFGCEGKGNALVDMMFAIIRFLSVGVGIVVVGSLVWAGVQYTSSRGDPNATAKAKERIQSTLLALVVYIFAAAILNFVIPGNFITV
jgi:hypothetical protein